MSVAGGDRVPFNLDDFMLGTIGIPPDQSIEIDLYQNTPLCLGPGPSKFSVFEQARPISVIESCHTGLGSGALTVRAAGQKPAAERIIFCFPHVVHLI